MIKYLAQIYTKSDLNATLSLELILLTRHLENRTERNWDEQINCGKADFQTTLASLNENEEGTQKAKISCSSLPTSPGTVNTHIHRHFT